MIEMILLSVAVAAAPQTQEPADTSATVLTLEDAIRIALSENVSVKVVKLIQSYTGVVNKMVWRKY